jgi:hypothetical protein
MTRLIILIVSGILLIGSSARPEEIFLSCEGSHPDSINLEFSISVNEKKKIIIAKNREYQIKELNNTMWLGTSLINDTNKNTDEVIKLDRVNGSGNIYYRRNKEDGRPMYQFSERKYAFQCKKVERKF